jgi:hypothetical protein
MIHRLLPAKTALFAGLIVMGALNGCQALDEMEADGYREQCANLGIRPGSASFDQCMLQQQALSENETEHSLDRMEREEEAKRKK